MRDTRYIEIPGSGTHELPPLLVHASAEPLTDLEGVLVEADEMLDADANEEVLEQRRMDLALQLAEQYKGLMSHWFWGDGVLEWIRQCEITFECEGALRKLLHPDGGRTPAAPASSSCCAKRACRRTARSNWRKPSGCA